MGASLITHAACCTLQAQLLVSHVSHHNVRVLRFSPFEPDTFLSAGRDSIRSYRLKAGSLRAISIRLDVSGSGAGSTLRLAMQWWCPGLQDHCIQAVPVVTCIPRTVTAADAA